MTVCVFISSNTDISLNDIFKDPTSIKSHSEVSRFGVKYMDFWET